MRWMKLQAKKKPIKKMKPEDLNVDITPRLETIQVVAPPVRKGGAKVSRLALFLISSVPSKSDRSSLVLAQVDSVEEVVAKLKAAGVL